MLVMGIAYLLSLPVCVWLLATLCAIVDEPHPIRAIIRLVIALCILVALMILTERTLIYPLIAGFVTVTAFHIIGFWATRRFWLGVPIYIKRPTSLAELEEDPY